MLPGMRDHVSRETGTVIALKKREHVLDRSERWHELPFGKDEGFSLRQNDRTADPSPPIIAASWPRFSK